MEQNDFVCSLWTIQNSCLWVLFALFKIELISPFHFSIIYDVAYQMKWKWKLYQNDERKNPPLTTISRSDNMILNERFLTLNQWSHIKNSYTFYRKMLLCSFTEVTLIKIYGNFILKVNVIDYLHNFKGIFFRNVFR